MDIIAYEVVISMRQDLAKMLLLTLCLGLDLWSHVIAIKSWVPDTSTLAEPNSKSAMDDEGIFVVVLISYQ